MTSFSFKATITDGGRQRTGSDFNHIMEQDYAYILAARIGAEYPEKNWTFLDRGVSGDRNVDLAARWKTDVLDLKPNLVSPSYCRSAVTSRLTRRVCRSEAKTRRREVACYHLPVVRHQEDLTRACVLAPAEYWAWDGVHPTYAGHMLMAKEWLRTVKAFWRQG